MDYTREPQELHMGTKLPHLMNCSKMITLFQSIIKTCKHYQQRKYTKYPICLLPFLTIFLREGLPLITYVTYNHLIVPADYVQKRCIKQDLFEKNSFTNLAIVSTIIKHFFNTQFRNVLICDLITCELRVAVTSRYLNK